MKRILIWNTYGCTTTQYVLERFMQEGHGAIFADEAPIPAGVPRLSYVVQEFLEGKTGNTFLVLTRDILVADLISLLAKRHRVKVFDLPKWPALKIDKETGREVCKNGEDDFQSLVKAVEGATPHEVSERPYEEE